jgi:hypothetical protein
VFNLDATIALNKAWEAFVLGNNLFDRHYANFGVLGSNDFAGPGNTYNGNGASSQFVGVGQPLGVWAGLRYRFK